MRALLALATALILLPQISKAEVCAPTPEQILHGNIDYINTDKDTLVLLVHASTAFHGSDITRQGIAKTIGALQDKADVVYVHTGNYKKALFPNCTPKTFYESSSGNVKLNLSAKNVVLMGGNFSLCLNDTWKGLGEAIKNQKTPGSVNLFFVTDGIYDNVTSLATGHGLIPSSQAQNLLPRVGLSPNFQALAGAISPDQMIRIMTWYFDRKDLPPEYEIIGHWNRKDFQISKGKQPRYQVNVHFVKSSEIKTAIIRANLPPEKAADTRAPDCESALSGEVVDPLNKATIHSTF